MTPLPQQITAAVLRQLAAPDETHAIRVILMNTPGATIAILRGVRRKYLLQRDGHLGRHTLDIPASLWAQDMPTDRYRDNKSIAHDLMSKPSHLSPFITTIVPWGTPVAAQPAVADALATDEPAAATVILGYLRQAKAPDHIIDQVSAIALNPGEHLRFLEEPDDERSERTEQPDIETATKTKSETPAAKRMREKRARDRKEREAKKAALQPA